MIPYKSGLWTGVPNKRMSRMDKHPTLRDAVTDEILVREIMPAYRPPEEPGIGCLVVLSGLMGVCLFVGGINHSSWPAFLLSLVFLAVSVLGMVWAAGHHSQRQEYDELYRKATRTAYRALYNPKLEYRLARQISDLQKMQGKEARQTTWVFFWWS